MSKSTRRAPARGPRLPSPQRKEPGATCLHASLISAFLTVGVHAIVPIEPSEFAVGPAAEVS
jgi:hypothetical protein